jgi:hypothetical protein
MAKPKPPKMPQYASVCPGRNPETKYQNMGQAKNAVAYTINYGVRGGEIWEWMPEENDWFLLYDIPKGMMPDDLPWRTDPHADYKARIAARERWSRQRDFNSGIAAQAGAGA